MILVWYLTACLGSMEKPQMFYAGYWSLRKGVNDTVHAEGPGHTTEKGGLLLLGWAGRHLPGILGAAFPCRQKCTRVDTLQREKQHPQDILGSL